MPKTSVYNMAGEAVGEIELSDAVFGVKPNKTVLHTAVVNYLANQRQGTQSTLTRTEVAGGGRKPWKQKGTGHARQGSTRAPQWRHGGIALGPKPRDYGYTINRKVKQLAMKSALSSKVEGDGIKVLDSLTLDGFKTKTVVGMLEALKSGKKVLIVTPDTDEKVIISSRNIPGVKTAVVGSLNVYDILDCDTFVILKDAVTALEEVYA